MKKLPYFPFYYLDWLSSSSVRMMDHAERGLYMDMICTCYNDNGLPDDNEKLQRLFNCDERLLNSVKHMFYSVENVLRHEKLDSIIEDQEKMVSLKSKAGLASAKSRADKKLSTSTPVQHVLNSVATQPQQDSTNRTEHNKTKHNNIYTHEIKDLCECFLIAKIDQYEQDGLKPPKCLKPSNDQLNKWYEAIEKLTRIDGYPVDEIRPVIMATLTDEFLSKNVLTLGKLRNKWKDGKTCFEHCYETFKGSPTARTKDNDDPYADVDGETMFMSAEDHLKASQY